MDRPQSFRELDFPLFIRRSVPQIVGSLFMLLSIIDLQMRLGLPCLAQHWNLISVFPMP